MKIGKWLSKLNLFALLALLIGTIISPITAICDSTSVTPPNSVSAMILTTLPDITHSYMITCQMPQGTNSSCYFNNCPSGWDNSPCYLADGTVRVPSCLAGYEITGMKFSGSLAFWGNPNSSTGNCVKWHICTPSESSCYCAWCPAFNCNPSSNCIWCEQSDSGISTMSWQYIQNIPGGSQGNFPPVYSDIICSPRKEMWCPPGAGTSGVGCTAVTH